MIIETLTGFTAVKFVWETLEVIHLIHVGHMTIDAVHHKGSSFVNAIQERLNTWEDKVNPGQRLEREAKTSYDFTTIDDKGYQEIKEGANQYLTDLNNSVLSLRKAKTYFSQVNDKLYLLAKESDEEKITSRSLVVKNKFDKFKNEFKEFLSLLNTPPRQQLYIADLLNQEQKGTIAKFNENLKEINACLKEIQKIRIDISNTLHGHIDDQATSAAILDIERLQRNLNYYINNSNALPKTIAATSSANTELTDSYMSSIEKSTTTQQIDVRKNQAKNNPKWLPLLNEKKQIEVGQRIFIHAMNEKNNDDEEKLLLAEVFLRQPVPNHELNQATIDLLAHQLANCLRVWQLNECRKQIAILKTLVPGAMWPKSNPGELIEWLKTKRKEQSVNDLFIKVFVSPCLFSNTSLDAALPKLKNLFWDQSVNCQIRKYKESYWGAIREKNDALVQLPKSFKSKILKRDSILQDTPAKTSHVISAGIHDLAKKLITDLEMLTKALQTDHTCLKKMLMTLSTTEKEAFKVQQEQENEKGVARVKKCHRYIDWIECKTNSLFPYLYNAQTINEDEKKHQVPTIDDLFYVIYKGLDPNEICAWKHSSLQPYSESDQLIYYFLENQQDESLTKAFFYAVYECQASSTSLFSHRAFSLTRPFLVSENTAVSADNILSIDVILKYPNKTFPIPPDSQALKEVSPKTRQEAEIAFKELQDYQVFALTRMTPQYIKKLPVLQRLKYSIKNLFQSTRTNRQEHLESVQTFISDLCAVFSAEDTYAIGRALERLQRDYDEKCQKAQKNPKSVLYTTMLRLMKGPIAELSCYFSAQEPTPSQQPENPVPKQEKLIELEQSHHKTQQKQKDFETQVEELRKELAQKDAECKETLAQKDAECQETLAQNNAKWQEKLDQNNAEWEEKLRETLAQKDAGWVTRFSQFFMPVTQPALDSRSMTASNDERPGNSHNTRFFKP